MFNLRKQKDKGIFAQGIYYFATGLWPFVHRRSFLKVTGPKNDLWLVHAVGSLVTATGVVFLRSAAKRRVTPEIRCWLPVPRWDWLLSNFTASGEARYAKFTWPTHFWNLGSQ